jgi:pSer/pThr/pTyr-binding forkhead associated (FHA) protein
MIDQILLLFQALFLVLLYVFIWRIVRSASRDLRLPQESFLLTPAQAAAQGFPVAPAVPTSRLVIETSPSLEAGQTFEVGSGPLTIGRSESNVIALPTDEFVSARHARVEPLRDGLWVVDLGSRNGTFLNGAPVDGRERLEPGDLLRIGDTQLRVAS